MENLKSVRQVYFYRQYDICLLPRYVFLFGRIEECKNSLWTGYRRDLCTSDTLPVNYLLETYILKAGALKWLGAEYAQLDLSFLSLIMFIAIIASMVQLVEMFVEKYSPSLYASLGIFLPLIAVNCAILGGSLFMQQRNFPSVTSATVYGIGSGIGWMLAIVCLAAIREKLSYSNIPAPLRGIGITFIITGLMGIAFMSFLGIKL